MNRICQLSDDRVPRETLSSDSILLKLYINIYILYINIYIYIYIYIHTSWELNGGKKKATIKILKKLKKYLDNEVEPRKKELSLQVLSYSF